MSSTKSLGKHQQIWPDFKLESRRWNPVGRVDIYSSLSHSWLRFEEENYFYRIVTIDGTSDTTLIELGDQLYNTRFFRGTSYGQAFQLLNRPAKNTLVIGVGGAPDIESALNFRSERVVGVEVNSSVLDGVRKFLPRIAGDPRVRLVNLDGRSYVAQSKEKFDIIQLSGVDAVAALQWGAYIQAENYLYTVEAFEDFLNHLSPGGILNVGMFELIPPRQMLKICAIAVEAMRRMGIKSPEQKIILVQYSNVVQMLVRKESFLPQELARYRAQMAAGNLRTPLTFEDRLPVPQSLSLWIRYAPGITKSNDRFFQFFAKVAEGREKDFIRDYQLDISPATDNRPFFYKYFRWTSLAHEELSGIVLISQVLEAVGFAGIFILLPLFWMRKKSPAPRSQLGVKQVWFFFLIGLGYMMVEIPLIQRFALYLGHPSYALALVLGVLLASSGLGSWIYQECFAARRNIIWASISGIIIFNLLTVFLAPNIISLTMSHSFVFRCLLTSCWAALPGFFMGMVFPAGIRNIARGGSDMIPWAWAVNTSASVVSSILVVILATGLGFQLVSILACLCYLLAGIAFQKYHL